MKKPSRVISVGYGRHMFTADNNERRRMETCAAELDELHMIVFTHKKDGLKKTTGQNCLVLHPTNSRFKVCMVLDAVLIGRRIIKSGAAEAKPLPHLTTQDPFEAGLVGYVLKKLYNLELTIQEHGDVFSTEYWRAESIGNKFRYTLGKWLLRRADVVRVVSARMVETMQTLRVKAPVTQLPVAIDVERFSAEAKLASKLGDTFTYLTVARFVPQKNLPLLIKAFAAAYKANTSLRLQIVGQGPEEARVRASIAEQFPPVHHQTPPVTIQAWSNDVPALMHEADAYVLSSNYEGWGRVLIEALAAKLPIVSTDVGCVGEVVVDSEHGLVVPVSDQSALTVALVQLAKPEVYNQIYNNLTALQPETMAGTNLSNYGQQWVSTLVGR